MALACQPRVLLADEPTTALDVMVQAQILDLLIRLSSELGLALVLVTHDLPVVAQTCGRAAVMYAGEIAECGPMETLFHQPRHPYTRLLFAATPDLYGTGEVVSMAVPAAADQRPWAARSGRAVTWCSTAAPRSTRPCGWSGPATRPRAIMPNGRARRDRKPRGFPCSRSRI